MNTITNTGFAPVERASVATGASSAVAAGGNVDQDDINNRAWTTCFTPGPGIDTSVDYPDLSSVIGNLHKIGAFAAAGMDGPRLGETFVDASRLNRHDSATTWSDLRFEDVMGSFDNLADAQSRLGRWHQTHAYDPETTARIVRATDEAGNTSYHVVLLDAEQLRAYQRQLGSSLEGARNEHGQTTRWTLVPSISATASGDSDIIQTAIPLSPTHPTRPGLIPEPKNHPGDALMR